MSTTMTAAARDRFLLDRRIGVLFATPPDDPGAAVAAPIWYDYSPDAGIKVVTGKATAKAQAIESAGRFCLVVQDETLAYRYVSAAGPVVETRPADHDGDLLPISARYLDGEPAAAWAQQWADDTSATAYLMRPDRWRSADLTEAFDAFFRSIGPAPTGAEVAS